MVGLVGVDKAKHRLKAPPGGSGGRRPDAHRGKPVRGSRRSSAAGTAWEGSLPGRARGHEARSFRVRASTRAASRSLNSRPFRTKPSSNFICSTV